MAALSLFFIAATGYYNAKTTCVMKKTAFILLVTMTFTLSAQRNKAPKMEPEYAAGYYVSSRGDTIYGEIQTNPDDEVTFYREFNFKAKNAKKPRPYNMSRAKGYGFNNRHFVVIDYEGKKFFVERLTSGRLDFYEHRFHGKIDGFPAIESDFFVKDTWAQGDELSTKGLKKLSNKFYKKSLKPYMSDQPMIWSDLDKYTFDKNVVVRSISEYNQFYADKAN